MLNLRKLGAIVITMILIAVAWNFLAQNLGSGDEDQETYLQLFPLTATSGSLCSFELETNVNSFTVTVPENILIVKDGMISSNSTQTFNGANDKLQLLLPPTVENQFVINIESSTIKTSFQISVKGDTNSLVSGDEFFDYVRILTSRYVKRFTGSPMLSQAASYLQEQLNSYGLETELMRFERENREVINVIGYHWGLERPEEWIVLGGHYDIKEKTIEGAYDNTAGTVAVLEIAKAVSQMKTDRTIVFCLWSGEEQGLWGSQAFVDDIPENVTVKTYLNYDMVGLNWPQPWQLNVLIGSDEVEGDLENPELLNISNRVVTDILQYPSSGFDVKESGEGSSDHESFWATGVPTVYYVGKIVYFGYHNKADDLATMEVEALGRENLKAGFETVVWISYYTTVLLDNDELVVQKDS